MTRLITAVAAIALTVVFRSGERLCAQVGTGQLVDAYVPIADGNGAIRGRAIAADTRLPLPRTLIELSAPAPAASRSPRQRLRVFTDDQGRFELQKIPAGSYTLSAAKAGYASMTYRQTRPQQPPRPVELVDRQVLDDVEFVLQRQGVIVARVTDDFGEPVPSARVQLQQLAFVSGQRQLVLIPRTGQMATNEFGEVRVAGLLPGEYYLSVSPPDDTLSAIARNSGGPQYTTTYSPGTVTPNDASPIKVLSGQESYAALAMQLLRLGKVTGVMRRSDGSVPVKPNVAAIGSLGLGARSVPVVPDGTFTLNLTPGDYTLMASSDSGGPAAEFATLPITLTGDDRPLTVVTARGGTVRGRVTFEGGLPASLQPASLPLMLAYAAGGGLPMPMGPTSPTWRDAGLFEFNGVGGSRALVFGAAEGWYLKSVSYAGRDIADLALDLSNGRELIGVEVELTRRPATLQGVVQLPSAAGDNAVVILFSVDRARWTPTSSAIATTRPDEQGRFTVTGLRSGSYYAVAVDYLDTGEERDVQLLQRLAGMATTVTIADGESITVSLAITER